MKQICKHCGEEIPHLSRICPTCLYNDSYSADILGVETPLHMLNMMRSLLDECLAAGLPKILDRGNNNDEVIATFESIRDVVMLSFGKNSDVVDAVVAMEDILYERIELHRKRYRRNKIAIILLSTTLIFSLSALIYSALQGA